MAKITKPDMTYVWASGGSKTAPSNVKIQTGWIVEKPEFEKMNWVQNRQDDSLAYIFQMGVPEWDSAVEYQYSATYKSYVQRNGLVYKALQVGTNKDPASEATYWTVAFDDKGAAATVQSNLTTHITNYGTLTGLTNAATARTSLDVYSKGEGDARYAALAGISTQLFSVANGTTGYEAVNYSQLITKANTNGNASNIFKVAVGVDSDDAVRKSQLPIQATDSIVGISREATAAEVLAGALSGVFISPDNLSSAFPANDTAFQLSISLPNGYILKMGWTEYGELPVGVVTVPTTFTNAFPLDCLFALASPYNPNLSGQMAFICTMRSWSDVGISVDMVELSGSGDQFDASYVWFAIGK